MKSVRIKDLVEAMLYTDLTVSQIAELWAGRCSLTPIEILDLDTSVQNRLGLLFTSDVLDARTQNELGYMFAKHVLPIFEKQFPEDSCPRESLDIFHRWNAGNAAEIENFSAGQKVWALSCTVENASEYPGKLAVSAAIYSVSQALWRSPFSAARAASLAAGWAVSEPCPPEVGDAAKAAEGAWQIEQTKIVLLAQGW